MTESPAPGPEVSLEAWQKKVEADLAGTLFDRALRFSTLEGITLPALALPKDWSPPEANTPTVPLPVARRWQICPRHDLPDLAGAAKLVAEDVEGGAHALLLQLDENGIPMDRADELATLLAPLAARPIPIWADAGGRFAEVASLLDGWWATQPEEARRGGYGADPLGALARGRRLSAGLDKNWDALAELTRRALASNGRIVPITVSSEAHHRAGASLVEEIGALLATSVRYLRALESRGLDPAQVAPSISLRLFLGSDLYVSIAALRALRLVWAELCSAAGWPTAVTIFAESSPRMLSVLDPAMNLLRVTASTFAGAIGRADLITSLGMDRAAGPSESFARRLARNTQWVLAAESQLGAVVDPVGGSWFFELASDRLAERAWACFQEIEAHGGMDKVLLDGWWRAKLLRIATERSVEVRRRKSPMLGVSELAELDEPSPEGASKGAPRRHLRPPLTAPTADDLRIDPLPDARLAEPFEALRDRSDRHLKKHSERPKLFVIELGPRSAFAARSAFTTQLLCAGGLLPVVHTCAEPHRGLSEAYTKSGAKAAVICSSDEIYDAHVATVATILQLAGAKAVGCAGRPGEHEEAWRATGVDFFVFHGGDAVDALERLYTIVEVEP